MNRALSTEKAIFSLWARKPILTSDECAQQVIRDFEEKGFVSGKDGNHTLTEEGLEFVLNGRSQDDMTGLLEDIEMSQEERFFLANAIREMVDKPFAYEIIKKSRESPNREKYPSVDLGAYEDIEHGVLFGARTHIMIDPLIRKESIERILQKLDKFGASITEHQKKGYGAHILYNISDMKRELYIVGTEAMKIDANLYKRVIEGGIFALMMKGLGGKKDRYGSVLDALEYYSHLLTNGGFLLTAKPLQSNFRKVGEGNLSYESHVYDGVPGLVNRALYQKSS